MIAPYIPKTIHQIWLGPNSLPEQHQKWVKSVVDLNPDFTHILWSDARLKQAGIDVDAIRDHYWSQASVSNMIRLYLLQRFGGIYLDTDCECLKPLDHLLIYKAFAAIQDSDRICNAVMGAEAGHPWIAWQIYNAEMKASPHDAAWGVYTASAAPRKDLTIIPTKWVYPFLWTTPADERKPHPDSCIVHHWSGSWVKK